MVAVVAAALTGACTDRPEPGDGTQVGGGTPGDAAAQPAPTSHDPQRADVPRAVAEEGEVVTSVALPTGVPSTSRLLVEHFAV